MTRSKGNVQFSSFIPQSPFYDAVTQNVNIFSHERITICQENR